MRHERVFLSDAVLASRTAPRAFAFVTTLMIGLLGGGPALAAQLTKVDRAKWAGNLTLPSYATMYIYVPDKLASNPPVVVSSHACGSTAEGQMGNNTKIKAAADKNGFIMILPDNPGQNCWDVGANSSLKHDGGGDTQAVAQMVKYALTTYNGDAKRVYALGGSSGAMMTQALMAVYPDVFRAGAARAGVPAGCWADGYDSSNQWSGRCAGGNTTKTAQQWGDMVRAMFPGYTGHRPRIQLFHGAVDETISYKNFAEAIKEWTNVLGLATSPTSTDKITTSTATYDRQFWKDNCGVVVLEAWSGQGGKHSMAYEEADILRFFGLTAATDPDPEASCGGDGGVISPDGSSGSGGTTGSGGTGGAKDGGAGAGGKGARDGGIDAEASSGGGTQASAGSSGGNTSQGGSRSGGGTGGRSSESSASQGGGGSGGVVVTTSAATSSSGAPSSSSRPSSSASSAGGGTKASSSSGGTGGGADAQSSSGCGCVLGGHSGTSAWGSAMLLFAALAMSWSRRRGRGSSTRHQ